MNVKITAICEIAKEGYICVGVSGNLHKPKHVLLINYETENGEQGLTTRGVGGTDLSYFCGASEDINETHRYNDVEESEIEFNSTLLLYKVTDWIGVNTIRVLAKEAETEYREEFDFYKKELIRNIVESKVETEKGLLDKLSEASNFNDLLYLSTI